MHLRKNTLVFFLAGFLSINFINAQNPIIHADVPDNSMIRVGDTYYWTNFAKYGHPNGEGVPEWPAFSAKDPTVMYLTAPQPFVGPVPSAESLEVLDGYFRWRRSPEGAAWAK